MSAPAGVQRRQSGGLYAVGAQLNLPADRLAAMLEVIAAETEPIVSLTLLLYSALAQLLDDRYARDWLTT